MNVYVMHGAQFELLIDLLREIKRNTCRHENATWNKEKTEVHCPDCDRCIAYKCFSCGGEKYEYVERYQGGSYGTYTVSCSACHGKGYIPIKPKWEDKL